ncbi:secreted RxLR effector protein 161-like [Rutidosis leptorrhynchoides]|uniref:secreted RxLR effector protein 161-like n=1 Tax=Rutidosis leptorrhynchoides TaxID=125765 RepID=UPI003A991524
MGVADVILGISIICGDNGIMITQSHYIEKILKKFDLEGTSPVSTPIDPTLKLLPNTGSAVYQLKYSSAIGCLMYAMTCTIPDIAYTVGKLSRFTSNLGSHHWQAVNRVFKYLKRTKDFGITYTGFPSILEGYSDASWITIMEDLSSTTGWIFLLGGGVISWASKKQICITNSTMESQFVALAVAGNEAEWLIVTCIMIGTKSSGSLDQGTSHGLGAQVGYWCGIEVHLNLSKWDTEFPSTTTLGAEFNEEGLF